jgi:hypothetical protein
MFTQMRAVLSLQRAQVNQRMLQGEDNLPPLLSPATCWNLPRLRARVPTRWRIKLAC